MSNSCFRHTPISSKKTSKNFAAPAAKGYFGLNTTGAISFRGFGASAIYDVFNPEARKFMFEKLYEGIIKPFGIEVFWLDADEPGRDPDQEHLTTTMWWGNGTLPSNAVGAMYPHLLDQAYYEGMTALGKDPVMLGRSAWAGTQRFGGAVWSGDITSTFETLRSQIRAGLNIMMSGISYWTTDIGGYAGGNIFDKVWLQLIVRWFQFGAFCPLFRIHGSREPYDAWITPCGNSGNTNEAWNFGKELGNQTYLAIRKVMLIREKLRPYIHEQYKLNSQDGTPIMRPLFFDFDDLECLEVEDEFMFGPDYLVAPQAFQDATDREVFLPKLPQNSTWMYYFDNKLEFKGGQTIKMNTPLDEFPLFKRTITTETAIATCVLGCKTDS